jgi:hypothetical protein
MTLRRIVALWFASGLGIGLLLNWHFRFNAAADTVSYLEIAQKYSHGRVSEAIVLYWSPFYSWLLIPVVRLSRAAQVPMGHALQFVLLPFVMWSTWRLLKLLHRSGASLSMAGAILVLGVGLVAALVVIPARYLTPDLVALGVVLWLVSRIGEEAAGVNDGALHRLLTGMLWGLAYLVRTYVAPFGIMIFLLAAMMVRGRDTSPRQHVRWLGIYLAGFFIIAGPWIGVLSHREGRLTWGESGRNNLLAQLPRQELRAPEWPQVLAGGHVRNFERPFPLISPESYDVVPGGTYRYHHFVSGYARIVVGNLEAMLFGFFPPDLPLYWPLGILSVLAGTAFVPFVRPQRVHERVSAWFLIAGIIGLLMFVLIHVESRYLAPFPVLIAAGIAGWPSGLTSGSQEKWGRVVALIGIVFWLFPFFVWINGLRSSQTIHPEESKAMAEWLQKNGHRYAVVGATYDLGLPAWLSQAELVASVDFGDDTPAACDEIAASLRSLQVSAVLGTRGTTECGRWQRIPGTGWASWNLSRITALGAQEP